MRVMVTGGTGTVGSQVAQRLIARGDEVAVLTRSADKPMPQGAKGVMGNLAEPATVRNVFKGYDAVFLINVVSPAETHEGLLGFNGARDCGVRRIVYLSVQNADQAPHLPHFGGKLPIEMALKKSGLDKGSKYTSYMTFAEGFASAFRKRIEALWDSGRR